MHQLDVREQVRLPFLRCVELVLNGIQYRLFRASITVVIVALAVAFLVTMLSNSLIVQKIAKDVEEKTSPRKKLLFWVNRLSIPMTDQTLRSTLLLDNQPGRMSELQRWGKLGEAELAQLRRLARDEETYLRFFRGIERPKLQRLIGHTSADTAIFQMLTLPGNLRHFEQAIQNENLKLPVPPDEFQEFLLQWSQCQPLRARIIQGHAQALQGAQAALKGRSAIETFAAPEESLHKVLGQYGFLISADEIGQLREEATNHHDTQQLEQVLQVSAFRQRLSNRLQVPPQDIEAKHLFELAGSGNGVQWLRHTVGQTKIALEMPVQRMRQIAEYNIARLRLAEVESKTVQVSQEAGPSGFSQRTIWLLSVSFLVCAVGITNAMLMSVTERFREIATMKCLGATDGFVMGNFLLESCMQGLAGGLVGAAVGGLLGFAKALAAYGWIAAANIPYSSIILLGLSAAGAGVILSALAAVYPAWVAARLAPLEAMRVE